MLGPILLKLNDSATVYVPAAKVAPAGLLTDVSKLEKREALIGPQARDDAASYLVWQKTDEVGGPAGKYFVNASGAAVWLVDPGINGTHTTRPDGSTVRKFDAPKATLMSYIIKGILDQKLPWALVLLGVMIAVTLELSFVPALAFAVGVYLPLSASSPIFAGGLVRWLVDRQMRKRASHAAMTPEQFTVRGGDGQESGSLARFGLHRGRGDCGHHHRVPRGGARSVRRCPAQMVHGEQSVLRRAACRRALDDPVYRDLRVPLFRGPRENPPPEESLRCPPPTIANPFFPVSVAPSLPCTSVRPCLTTPQNWRSCAR